MLKMLVTVDELAILLVDQEIRQALKIADYVYVLELGRNKFEGPAQQFTDLEKAFWVGGLISSFKNTVVKMTKPAKSPNTHLFYQTRNHKPRVSHSQGVYLWDQHGN